jgi:hypothetical protein
MKASLAVFALALVACNVEPPDLPPLDASFPDAQPFPDSGPKDAGEDAGTIDARPVTCGSSDHCADGDRCARPLTGTSTTDLGLCKGADRLTSVCTGDSECTGGVCTAHGFCAPAAALVTVDSEGAVSLISACTGDLDCGPAGICDETAGACARCTTNGDCPRELACQDGACVERPTCSTDLHCFPRNQCMSQRCVRESTCRTDGGDSPGNAIALEAALYQELAICNDREEGWFAFDLFGREGARIALTSTRTEATMSMELFDDVGDRIEGVRWLSLPGIQVAEIPAPGFDDGGTALERRLRIRVTSRDHTGRYDLDLARVTPLCPGDALDQYGDRARSRALPIEGNRTYLAVACPFDEDFLRLDADAGDQVVLEAAFAGSGTDLDLVAYAGTATLAEGRATNTSTETLDTGRIASAGSLLLRAVPRQAPSGGQAYQLAVTRFLDSFFDACNDAPDLPLVNGAASVSGDLAAAVDLGAPRCDNNRYADPSRRDLLYRITPPSAPSLLRAMITPDPASNGEITAAIVDACGTPNATTLYCDSAELPRRALMIEELLDDTAPLYLLVSSNLEDARFDLDLLIEPVALPPNNACAGAIEIVQSGQIEISTYGATNTVEATGPACGLADGQAQGPDAFYLVRVSGGERAAIELEGPRDGLIWGALDCARMTETCTVAQPISYANPVAQVALSPAADTTFFLAVDGLSAEDRGIFDLRTIIDPQCLEASDCNGALRCDDYRCVPVPSNDTCAGAQLVTLDAEGRATVVASTGAANDNIDPTCLGQSDRDVVYRVDLPLDRTSLTARVVEARFDPALAIRRSQCEASLEEVCNDDVRFPDEPQILLPEVTWIQPAAGTYYVIVDAFAGSGTFTLQIEAQE